MPMTHNPHVNYQLKQLKLLSVSTGNLTLSVQETAPFTNRLQRRSKQMGIMALWQNEELPPMPAVEQCVVEYMAGCIAHKAVQRRGKKPRVCSKCARAVLSKEGSRGFLIKAKEYSSTNPKLSQPTPDLLRAVQQMEQIIRKHIRQEHHLSRLKQFFLRKVLHCVSCLPYCGCGARYYIASLFVTTRIHSFCTDLCSSLKDERRMVETKLLRLGH